MPVAIAPVAMLKIDLATSDDGAPVLKLAGRVIGAWVAALAHECDRVLQCEQRLVVDLAAVSFVDREGAELLRSLAGANVRLLRCSPLVAAQLGIGAP